MKNKVDWYTIVSWLQNVEKIDISQVSGNVEVLINTYPNEINNCIHYIERKVA